MGVFLGVWLYYTGIWGACSLDEMCVMREDDLDWVE